MLFKNLNDVFLVNTMLSDRLMNEYSLEEMLTKDKEELLEQIYIKSKLSPIAILFDIRKRKFRSETLESEYDSSSKLIKERNKKIVMSYFINILEGMDFFESGFSGDRDKIKKATIFTQYSKDTKSIVIRFEFEYLLEEFDDLNKSDITRMFEADFSEAIYILNSDIFKKNMLINEYNVKLREDIKKVLEKRIKLEKRTIEVLDFFK